MNCEGCPHCGMTQADMMGLGSLGQHIKNCALRPRSDWEKGEPNLNSLGTVTVKGTYVHPLSLEKSMYMKLVAGRVPNDIYKKWLEIKTITGETAKTIMCRMVETEYERLKLSGGGARSLHSKSNRTPRGDRADTGSGARKRDRE